MTKKKGIIYIFLFYLVYTVFASNLLLKGNYYVLLPLLIIPFYKFEATPFYFLKLIIFEIFFLYFFIQRVGLSTNLEFIIDFTIFIYFILCLNNQEFPLEKEDIFLVLFFITGFISWLLIEQNIFSFLLTVRFFYLPFIVYVGTKLVRYSQKQIDSILKLLLLLSLLQIPFVIIELLMGAPWGDNISGSLGTNKNIVIFILSSILLSINFYYYKLKRITLNKFLIYLSLITILPLIASTLFYFLFVPVYLLAASFLKPNRSNVIKSIVLTGLFLSLFPLFDSLYDTYRPKADFSEKFYNLERLATYGRHGTKSRSFGRSQALIFVGNKIISFNNISALIGHGIGATKQSQTPSWRGKIEKEYYQNKLGRTFYTYILLEYGAIGLYLFLAFLFFHYQKAIASKNQYIKFLILTFCVVGFYAKWFSSPQPSIILLIILAFNREEYNVEFPLIEK